MLTTESSSWGWPKAKAQDQGTQPRRWIMAAAGAICAALTLMLTPAAAQTEDRGVLMVVIGRTLDRAQMGAYAASLGPIYAGNNGRYLAVGGPGRGVTCHSGPCDGRSAVVAHFPAKAAMDGFWWGEEYRKAIRLRDKAGVFTVFGAPLAAAPTPAPEGRLLLALSAGADPAYATAAAKAGATVLVSAEGPALTPLEGDAPWTHVTIAAFENQSAIDQFLNSSAGKAAAKRLAKTNAHLLISAAPPAPPAARA